jgi:uncharacterized membrane protein
MNQTDALVTDYLNSLDKELSHLPRRQRRELVLEISEHIDEARSDLETQSEAEMRTLLDRLGDPADIATEANERFGTRPKGGYGFMRRVVYFFVAVPVVFGVLWLVLSAVRAVAG